MAARVGPIRGKAIFPRLALRVCPVRKAPNPAGLRHRILSLRHRRGSCSLLAESCVATRLRFHLLRFVLTRLSLVIPTFIGMTLLVFILIRLVPGDPIETLAGERGIDPARHAALLKEYGLDQPVLVQYGI